MLDVYETKISHFSISNTNPSLQQDGVLFSQTCLSVTAVSIYSSNAMAAVTAMAAIGASSATQTEETVTGMCLGFEDVK